MGTQDGDHTLQIVGQNVEAHLCSNLFEGSGLEVGGAHPGLEGAERMFNGRAADAHALRRGVQPVLHGVDYGLMLPALDPALLAGRALGFQRTLGALARPVVVQGHSLLRRREAPSQTLVGGTAIGVLFRDVDEVLFAEPARSLDPEVSGLGTQGVTPRGSQARTSSPLK